MTRRAHPLGRVAKERVPLKWSRGRFSLGGMMLLVAAAAVILADASNGWSAIGPAIAFLLVTQLLLRVFLLAWPALARLTLGIRPTPPDSPADAVRFRNDFHDAMVCCHLGRYLDAEELLAVLARQSPGDPSVALARAWCARRLDRLDDAIRTLERGAVHNPREGLIFYALATAWSLAGSPPRALVALSRAIESDPDLREVIGDEPDFEAIREEPDFVILREGPSIDGG